MNIENSGVLAKLFKSEAGGSSLLSGAKGAEGFSEAFKEQLEQLIGIDAEALIAQQQKQGLTGAQILASLTGKELPEGMMDIDLEQTLSALTEVLEHIEMVGADSEAVLTGQLSEESIVEIKQLLESIDNAKGLADIKQILASEENTEALQNIVKLVDGEMDELKHGLETGTQGAAVLASLLKQSPAPLLKQSQASEHSQTEHSAAISKNSEHSPIISTHADGEELSKLKVVIGQGTKQVLSQLDKNEQGKAVTNSQNPSSTSLSSNASLLDKEPDNIPFDKEAFAAKISKTNEMIEAAKQGKLEVAEANQSKSGDEHSVSKLVLNMLPENRSSVAANNKVEIPAMNQPVNSPGWNKELGEKVVWMFNKTIPSAEVRLNPQHLGPISIKLDVSQDQASIAFTAQNAVVKEALEQALPKLREMLSTQQLNLTEVTVNQHQSPDQGQSRGFDRMAQEERQGQNQGNQTNVADSGDVADDLANEIDSGRAVASNGLLSIYA